MPGLTLESVVCEMRRLKNEIQDREIDLEPCMKASELADFERTNLTRFPADYRIFLLEIGNGVESGWLGPCREGISPFGKTPFGYPLGFSDLLKNLHKPFPYTERHIVEDTEEIEVADDEEKENEDSYAINRVRHKEVGGYITLGTSIRSYDHFWILICEGDNRGQVWIATWHGSFFPCTPRMLFRDWLMDWLENNGDLLEQSLICTQSYPRQNIVYSLQEDSEEDEDLLTEVMTRPSSYLASNSRLTRSVRLGYTSFREHLH